MDKHTIAPRMLIKAPFKIGQLEFSLMLANERGIDFKTTGASTGGHSIQPLKLGISGDFYCHLQKYLIF